MKCIAFHVATGKRCDGSVGKSSRALRFSLCTTHSKSALLCFVIANTSCEAVARENWTHVIDQARVFAAFRESWEPSFGPEVTAQALDAAAKVPIADTLDGYVDAIVAVVTPVLQAKVAAEQAAVRVQIATTDAFIANSEARLAQLIKWSDLLAQPILNIH